ncbi:hypothetical protein GCM10018980_20760 [Streptomyces capoamus]|uniref:Uncharacterized protein n=1 Tax=Streptomyces capoamus TaxID=68183 RepID=A0A919EUY6_9ACTN|nr:hypothetical protein GCM10010501_03110 [Streptomyces libani subsp. rufus]GHG43716.1 hypothetical protein GCM10018980_20760 [Streptomyces capoamus]
MPICGSHTVGTAPPAPGQEGPDDLHGPSRGGTFGISPPPCKDLTGNLLTDKQIQSATWSEQPKSATRTAVQWAAFNAVAVTGADNIWL